MKLNIIFSEYKNALFLGLLLFLMTLPLSSYSQTQATILNDNPTDQEILNALSGGGLSMSNPQLVWGNRDSQIAIFDNGFAAGFNFNQGILFSTGNARADLESHNNNLTVSRTHGSYSDPDLTGLVSAAVNDPVIFTFDLTLDSNQDALRVAFQFGSEEYPNYVASAFNDVFGFFVSGPGIAETINMARLPGSNGIVAINSVNGGYVGYNGSCATSPLDLTQTAYFVNNGHSTDTYMSGSCEKQVSNTNPGPKPVFIEYNGLTTLITYDLTGLIPGETYNFKIAIADTSDRVLDSGVLISRIQGTTGADVAIQKEIDNPNAEPGETVVFTLTASNLGPFDATDIVVSESLPSGYTFVSASADKGSYNEVSGEWTFSDLAVAVENPKLTIHAVVNSEGDYENVAIISASEEDPDLSNNHDSAGINYCGISKYYISQVKSTGLSNDKTYNSGFENHPHPAWEAPTTPGYGNFSSRTFEIHAGDDPFTFHMKADGNHPYEDYFYEVWVDRNQNGFFESDELIAASGPVQGGNYSFVFEGPEYGCDYESGTYTMRVEMRTYSQNSDCILGETEDYTIIVDSNCDDDDVPTTTADDCEGFYVVQGDTEAQLYYVTGPNYEYDTPIGDPYVEEYNAMGFNSQDGFLYAIVNKGSNDLLKIDPDKGIPFITNLGPISLLPSGNWNSGVFDNDGNYYVRENSSTGKLYKITDVDSVPNAVEIVLEDAGLNQYDLAWHSENELLYGVDIFGQLFSFDPNDTQPIAITRIGAPNLNGTGIFGGLAFDKNGDLIGLQHRVSGGYTLAPGYYSFDISSGQATFLKSADVSVFGDMAACKTGETLACDSNIYVVNGDGNQGTLHVYDKTFSLLYSYTNVDHDFNALGLNPNDGYLYAMTNKEPGKLNYLLQMDTSGLEISHTEVMGLPDDLNFNSGVFDGDGNYFIRSNGAAGQLYKVDVSTSPATATHLPLVGDFNTYDLAWNPADGLMYGFSMHGEMFTFDPNQAPPIVMTSWNNTQHGSGIFGGLIADNSGDIYGYQHRSGLDYGVGFYKFVNGEPFLISTDTNKVNGDMAFCGTLDLQCAIEMTAEVELMDGMDCVFEEGYFLVHITLTGSSPYTGFEIFDNYGNYWSGVGLGETITMEYPAGSEPSFYAYPMEEDDESCTATAEVESPEICETLESGEEACDWTVRVWSVTNGAGTSWSITDAYGVELAGESDRPATYNDIRTFNAAGPLTFTLNTDLDGYRSVNYNVINHPRGKIAAGTVRNKMLVIEDLTCEEDGSDAWKSNLENSLSSFDFSYYPNPVNDKLFIDAAKEITGVEIYNMAGKKILDFNKEMITGNEFDVSSLSNGIYVIRTILDGKQVETFRIVKK